MIEVRREAPEKFDGPPKDKKAIAKAIRKATEIWTGYYEGEAACIMGLHAPTVLSLSAYLWMYHTALVEDHKFLFVRHSQMWMKEQLQRYDEIWGHAVITNESGIRWLKWLGAEFDQPGSNSARFTIRKK